MFVSQFLQVYTGVKEDSNSHPGHVPQLSDHHSLLISEPSRGFAGQLCLLFRVIVHTADVPVFIDEHTHNPQQSNERRLDDVIAGGSKEAAGVEAVS